jgi:ParB family transcriptional regulator, chromosome partitioning protein
MTISNAAVEGKSEKSHEKLTEKRRALGRGLESLLPGPRVVTVPPGVPAPTLPQSARRDGAPAESSSQFSVVGSQSSDLSSPATADSPVAAVGGTVERLQAAASGQSADGEVQQLAIDLIDQNPYQTRRDFRKEALEELSRSIKVQGVLQPVVVRPGGDGRFILILGERRLRASMLAEIATIPAFVRRVSEQQAAEMTLVENLQRQDLNCIEQAEAFANLSKKFDMTQEEIGVRAGVSREAVSNYMRLLNLPESVIGALLTGKLTYSHARVLLQLRDDAEIWKFAKMAIEEKMSVTKLEEMVLGSGLPRPGAVNRSGGARWVDPNVKAAQRSIEEVLGMRVRIADRRGRGKISIEYATLEDFDRVVGMLKGGG